MRRVFKAPILLYDAGFGWALGERFLQVTHVGRRTGRRYRSVVEVLGRLPQEDAYVVMAGFGRSTDWLRNLQAGGGREVAVGRRRFCPVMRELSEDEAVTVLADYERRNRLIAPIVRAVLSRLLGWRYTGTADQRRRVVRELPLVALAPGAKGT